MYHQVLILLGMNKYMRLFGYNLYFTKSKSYDDEIGPIDISNILGL